MSENRDYEVGSFTDVAPAWANRLWAFLNEPRIVRQMVDSSESGRPAAEAIALHLFERFGDDVTRDRVKQFVGFLIRQVMERNGYVHTEYGKPTPANPVFTVASVYSRGGE